MLKIMSINSYAHRQKTEVPVLRPIIRLRNKPASSHPPATSRNSCAVPVLLTNVHTKQHGTSAHRTRAQARNQPQSTDGHHRSATGRPNKSCCLSPTINMVESSKRGKRSGCVIQRLSRMTDLRVCGYSNNNKERYS